MAEAEHVPSAAERPGETCNRCGRDGGYMAPSRPEGTFRHTSGWVCVDKTLADWRARTGDERYIRMLEEQVGSLWEALEWYAPRSRYQFRWRDGRDGVVPEHGASPLVWSRVKYTNQILEDDGGRARSTVDDLRDRYGRLHPHDVGFEMHRLLHPELYEEPEDTEDE